jgi:hypothetical protein
MPDTAEAAHQRRVSDQVVNHLAALLIEAKRGNIEAVATVAVGPNGKPIVKFAGEGDLVPSVNLGVDMIKHVFLSVATGNGAPASARKGYTLPRHIMANADVARLVNSDEVQSVVRAPRSAPPRRGLRKNPLKNLGAMLKLNPYAKVAKRHALAASTKKAAGGQKGGRPKDARASSAAFLARMTSDHDYVGQDYEVFSDWLGVTEKA